MHIFLRNFKFFIFLFSLSLNLNSYSHAHMRGTFLSEEDAENRSLELGCEGIHKNQDKWMPCKNCLLYTSPSPRDTEVSRMPSSA